MMDMLDYDDSMLFFHDEGRRGSMRCGPKTNEK